MYMYVLDLDKQHENREYFMEWFSNKYTYSFYRYQYKKSFNLINYYLSDSIIWPDLYQECESNNSWQWDQLIHHKSKLIQLSQSQYKWICLANAAGPWQYFSKQVSLFTILFQKNFVA